MVITSLNNPCRSDRSRQIWQQSCHPVGIWTESFCRSEVNCLYDNPQRKVGFLSKYFLRFTEYDTRPLEKDKVECITMKKKDLSKFATKRFLLPWYLMAGGVFVLFIEFLESPHSNPYMSPSLLTVGIGSIFAGWALFFEVRESRLAPIFIILSLLCFFMFLYWSFRLFT